MVLTMRLLHESQEDYMMHLLDMIESARRIIDGLELVAERLPELADEIVDVVRSQRQIISWYAERIRL